MNLTYDQIHLSKTNRYHSTTVEDKQSKQLEAFVTNIQQKIHKIKL